MDAVRSAPWRGGREATLDRARRRAAGCGRGMELARRVSDRPHRRRAAGARSGALVGSLLGRLLLDRGLATYERTWAGPDVLRDGAGAVVDVIGLGNRAAGSADGVTAMLEFAETHDIASTEVFGFGAHDGPGPLRILGCLAPLQSGFTPVVLAPCSRGLAVLRPRGPAEWLAVGQAPFVAGTARKLFDLLSAGAPEDLVQRPHAEVLPWDGVAEARLAERALRRSLLTITTNDGRRRRYTVLRSTDAYGDPWDPWDAIRHFLDDRFTQKRIRTGARRNRFAGRSPRTVGFRSMTETLHDPAPEQSTSAVRCRRRTGQAGAGGPRGQVVRALEGRRHLRVRPHPPARGDLLDRHPAADRERVAARRATSSPTPTPTWSPASSGCRASRCSTRWAGTTTACPPSAGCRTSTACAATPRCRTTPTSRRRRSRTRSGRCRSPGPTSSSSASSSWCEDEKAFETLWRTLGLSVDWKQHYTTIGPKAQLASQRAFLRNFARGEAYLQQAPTLWDVTFQTAVAQAELEAREYAGAYHRIAYHRPDGTPGLGRDDPPGAGRRGGGADRAPRRRALPGPVRHHRHLAGVRRRDPGRGAPRSPRWTRAPASPCAARSAT